MSERFFLSWEQGRIWRKGMVQQGWYGRPKECELDDGK